MGRVNSPLDRNPDITKALRSMTSSDEIGTAEDESVA